MPKAPPSNCLQPSQPPPPPPPSSTPTAKVETAASPVADGLEAERRALAAEQARLRAEADALQAERRQVRNIFFSL